MAKKNITETNEKIYDAKALVYLKYEGERIAPGTAFKVKESDVEEIKAKCCAEIAEIKEAPAPTDNNGGLTNTVNTDPTNSNGKGNENGGV